MNIQNDIKNVSHTIGSKLHGLGFWIIIIFMAGFLTGVTWCKESYSTKFDDAIKLKGVIHHGVVYDVKERVAP